MLSCCVTTRIIKYNDENDNDVSAIKNLPKRSLAIMPLKQILENEIYLKMYCKMMFTQFAQNNFESVTNISCKRNRLYDKDQKLLK